MSGESAADPHTPQHEETIRPHRDAAGTFLGHPKGLSFLFATEMWERFSFYGMRALLVLYMVHYLLKPGMAESVIGYGGLKRALEFVFGPLGVQPLASEIYGLYAGFVYLTPILGGFLADRVLGQRRTVVIGALMMAAGHFMMAVEPLFLFALFALILGNGAFKPNISTQVGRLYAPGDSRRDRAYSIFYVGINIGAFLAPLVCGTLGEEAGWRFGFGAAGVGMLISTAIYLHALRLLPEDRPLPRSSFASAPRQLDPAERQAVWALVLLFLPLIFFWAGYEQQGNTIALWADQSTDRHIALLGLRAAIPVTWFQAFNPFMIFAFTPLVVALWRRQAKRGAEPSTIRKMALGCFGLALGNLIMVAAAFEAGANGQASWLWLLVYFVIVTLGELYLSPTGLSLVTKVAPARTVGIMMGLWLATDFAGNLVAGWLGSFWSRMAKPEFFGLIAAIGLLAGLVILTFERPLRPIIRE